MHATKYNCQCHRSAIIELTLVEAQNQPRNTSSCTKAIDTWRSFMGVYYVGWHKAAPLVFFKSDITIHATLMEPKMELVFTAWLLLLYIKAIPN